MSTDLTEEHLDNLLTGYSGVADTDVLPRLIAEVIRHRAAQASSKERVRGVVGRAIMARLIVSRVVVDGHHLNHGEVGKLADEIAVGVAEHLTMSRLVGERSLPPRKEWSAGRYDSGDTREADGYESSDYVDGWNDALDAVEAATSGHAGARP